MKNKNISHRQLRFIARDALSQRQLTPVELAYDLCLRDGWLHLTAIAFNWLGQYASSSGYRAYCYAGLSVLTWALILLGLALYLPSASVSSDFVVLLIFFAYTHFFTF